MRTGARVGLVTGVVGLVAVAGLLTVLALQEARTHTNTETVSTLVSSTPSTEYWTEERMREATPAGPLDASPGLATPLALGFLFLIGFAAAVSGALLVVRRQRNRRHDE